MKKSSCGDYAPPSDPWAGCSPGPGGAAWGSDPGVHSRSGLQIRFCRTRRNRTSNVPACSGPLRMSRRSGRPWRTRGRVLLDIDLQRESHIRSASRPSDYDPSARKSSSDPLSHHAPLPLRLFHMSVRIQLVHIIERHQVKVDVWHAQAFDGDADPPGVRGQPHCFRKLLRCPKEPGI